MEQLLQPGWWFSFFPQWAVWWLFCVIASAAALPLTMRMFRGLPDRGAGLAVGIGLIITNFLSWMMSLEWLTAGRGFLFVRFAFLVVGCGLISFGALCTARGYARGRGALSVYLPGVVFLFIGLIYLPHGVLSVSAALILLVLGSIAAWLHAPDRFFRSLRVALVPFVVAQLLFLVAFAFFVNVRSYIPWATFEISLYQAEKWGNYAHLQSAMRTDALPPRDVWFNGEITNYYYGGHVLTATIAKATGTPLYIAFNLGLATIFALTITMGFSFILALVHLTTRKVRIVRGLTWHSGLAWGLFGTLAIGMFGNLDPFRQLFTRDLDWGVNQRWLRAQNDAQEEWKLQAGVPADIALRAYGAVSQGADQSKPVALRVELLSLASQAGERGRSADDYVESVRSRVQATLGDENLSPPQRIEAVRQQVLSPSDIAFYRALQNVNAVRLEERLLRHILQLEYEEALVELEESIRGGKTYAAELDEVADELDRLIDEQLNRPAIERLLESLRDPEIQQIAQPLIGTPGDAAAEELEEARRDRLYGRVAHILKGWLESASRVGRPSSKQTELIARLREAHSALDLDAVAFLDRHWGGAPPTFRSHPSISDLRFSWENISFISFWDSSRAIKSSKPGETFPGTITEFPYFSAILGDHHPHHFAIPFSLAALCACISLLRKNSRRVRDDFAYFRRSWPDMLTMSFFIGTVFAVNIWDAIVLAPIYALVVLISWRGVAAGRSWGWVGFAGFMVLLTLGISLLYNSMPGVVPLFQAFPFWVLAVGVLAGVLPVALFLLPHVSRWKIALSLMVLAAVCIVMGAILAPSADGNAQHSVFTIALRDLLVFAAIAIISSLWALRHPLPVARWWYGAGAVYAVIGGVSLLFVLPFQAFFTSPLQPEAKMFYEVMPPILSHELITAPDFWREFWRSSAINPFDAQLRTQMRDFFMHWGIFFVPIVVLIVSRIFTASRNRERGYNFMIMGIVFAVLALARVYLGYWIGALSLAFVILCLRNAIEFKSRAEGPVWVLLGGAFFWFWFSEALHFDDDMSGSLERYNSVFKVYYPLWAIMAGGMVVAVREIFARFRVRRAAPTHLLLNGTFWIVVVLLGVLLPMFLNSFLPARLVQVWFFLFWIPTAAIIIVCLVRALQNEPYRPAEIASAAVSRLMSNWPAFVVAIFIGCLGMYYPIAATATRTREFFTWPSVNSGEMQTVHRRIYLERTLDALNHYERFPQYRHDFRAVRWMTENLSKKRKVLELAGAEAYAHPGRMSAGSGLATVINWMHHENQWRGRSRPAPRHLKEEYMERLEKVPHAVPDMNAAFRAVIPDLVESVPQDVQRRLRLADSSRRLDILRDLVPTATVKELYRLRHAVERHDISMMAVMNLMLNDSLDMYRLEDEDRVRRLFDHYEIDYVVVGELERERFGGDIADRFLGWGFEEIYSSADPEHVPENRKPTDKPTVVFKVPADFPLAEEVTE